MLGLNKIGLDLRIGSKLGITSGIGALLLAGIVIGQMFGNGQIKDSTDFFLRNNDNRLTGVYMRSATRAMQIAGWELGQAATGAEIKKAGDDLTEQYNVAVKPSDYLVNAVRNPDQSARAKRARALIEQYNGAVKELAPIRNEVVALQAKSNADTPSAIAALDARYVKIVRERMAPVAEELGTVAQKMDDFNKHQVETGVAAMTEQMSVAERIGFGLAGAAALVLIGAAFFLFFSIARPVRALTGAMQELAGGRFDIVLPGLGRKDEIGDIAGGVGGFKIKAAEK